MLSGRNQLSARVRPWPEGIRLDCDTAAVVSDLHIGSARFLHERFAAFLRRDLPPGAALVLNGDVLDLPLEPPEGAHRDILRLLVAESARRRVVWIYGNHDPFFDLGDAGAISFADYCVAGSQLAVVHGHQFTPFFVAARMVSRLSNSLIPGEPLFSARNVRRVAPWVFSAVRAHIARRAARFAVRGGCAQVACGHTHWPEERTVRGVRYVNTGSWTERRTFWLHLEAGRATLREVGDQTGKGN